MSDPSLPDPAVAIEAEKFNRRSKVAKCLGTNPDMVYDASEEIGHKTRYEFYFVTRPDGDDLFVKVASTPELNESLNREATATQIAKKLGVPCKDVALIKTPDGDKQYSEIDGKGIIALELLDSHDWEFLATPEQLATLEGSQKEQLVSAAVASIRNLSGIEVPKDIDTSSLRFGDTAHPRYKSPDSVSKEFDENERVADMAAEVFADDSDARAATFRGLNQELRVLVDHLNTLNPPDGRQYFVHGDMAPNNMCVSKGDDRKSLVLDFEHAGKTEYRMLAKLTDMSNFIGRCWPNPELKRDLLRSLLDSESDELGPDDSYRLVRSATIFGALLLAKYGMAHDHPEHKMSVAILNQLEEDLKTIDDDYRRIATEREATSV